MVSFNALSLYSVFFFHGLHYRSNPPCPDPLSPGPVSPGADLCGESSRHHMLVLCSYELYSLELLGLWHQVWRTQQNKDLTATRCSNVLPYHLLCFVSDLPQIATLPVEGDMCLFARDYRSTAAYSPICFNSGCQLMPDRKRNIWIWWMCFFLIGYSRIIH